MSYVFVDVDTQIDFLYPTGVLIVPGSTAILPRLAALTRFASQQKLPILSTADAHLENDIEFKAYPAHCVKGTWGAARVPETLTAKPILCEYGKALPMPEGGALPGNQWILEKRTLDIFEAPGTKELFAALQPQAFVVYGVVTEICVARVVRGLLSLGKPVVLVSDAIFALEDSKAHDEIGHWRLAGCKVSTTAAIIAS